MRPLPTLYHASLTRYDDAKFRHILPRNGCRNNLIFYHFRYSFRITFELLQHRMMIRSSTAAEDSSDMYFG